MPRKKVFLYSLRTEIYAPPMYKQSIKNNLNQKPINICSMFVN